jgi:hypothetical protein
MAQAAGLLSLEVQGGKWVILCRRRGGTGHGNPTWQWISQPAMFVAEGLNG